MTYCDNRSAESKQIDELMVARYRLLTPENKQKTIDFCKKLAAEQKKESDK